MVYPLERSKRARYIQLMTYVSVARKGGSLFHAPWLHTEIQLAALTCYLVIISAICVCVHQPANDFVPDCFRIALVSKANPAMARPDWLVLMAYSFQRVAVFQVRMCLYAPQKLIRLRIWHLPVQSVECAHANVLDLDVGPGRKKRGG